MEIGKALERDHSNVIYLLQTGNDYKKVDKDFRSLYEKCCEACILELQNNKEN